MLLDPHLVLRGNTKAFRHFAEYPGAGNLASRTWNRYGEKGAPGDRNGLDRIEIIELIRKDADLHPSTRTPLQTP